MPTRLLLPGPSVDEERRHLAESVADLHYTIATIVEAGGELLPGEAIEEVRLAWEVSEGTFRQLAFRLVPDELPLPEPPTPRPTSIPLTELQEGDLLGPVGHAKRSALQRLRDRFFKFWNSLPRTDATRAQAAEAGGEYLDLGATVVSSMPGYEKAVELISLVKQLVDQRAKRKV